jgi:hypothetical protein
MSSFLKRLIQIEPPPANPVAPGSHEDWRHLETELRLHFPTNLKQYIRTYGAGQWAKFLGIMNPFYQWKHPQAQGYHAWVRTRLDGFYEMRAEFPDYVAPFNRHPSPGGLFPFGYDDNGGTLCWQVQGEPDLWPIIYLDGKQSDCYDRFDLTLTHFLVALLSGEISAPQIFPADLFPIARPAFRPYSTE